MVFDSSWAACPDRAGTRLAAGEGERAPIIYVTARDDPETRASAEAEAVRLRDKTARPPICSRSFAGSLRRDRQSLRVSPFPISLSSG